MAMEAEIATLRADQIPVVVASGDEGQTGNANYTEYPACLSSAISVGSVTSNDTFSTFTNHGSLTKLFAPGEYIATSTIYSPTGAQYITAQNGIGGTSFAAPQVAGAFALIDEETNDSLTVDQLVSLFLRTGRYIQGGIGNQVSLDIGEAGIVALRRQDAPGVYRNNTFIVPTGINDPTVAFTFGAGTDAYPVVGDWSGHSYFDELGVYSKNSAVFTLCNATAAGTIYGSYYYRDNSACRGTNPTYTYQFTFGNPGDVPISGVWYPRPTQVTPSTYPIGTAPGASDVPVHDANFSVTGIGILRSSDGLALIRYTPSTGYADISTTFGSPGDEPVSGDWNDDGQATLDLYRPSNSNWFLTNELNQGADPTDIQFTYGLPGGTDIPVSGNWYNYDSVTVGIGVYRTSVGVYYLRNELSTGTSDISVVYGNPGDTPITGDWLEHSIIPQPQINNVLPTHLQPPVILIAKTPQPASAPNNGSSGSVPGGNQIGG